MPIETCKLGKLAARPGSASFKFGTFFNAKALPTPPLVFGHEYIGRPWGELGNNKHSCCLFSGAAHEHMVWGHEGGKEIVFDDASVLSDYSAVTGFDPARPETDQGTDMTEAASYRRKTGVVDAAGVRHTIDSYVALKAGAVDELMVAAYLMGGVGIGLRFTDTAMQQFDDGVPWTVADGKVIGGHYVNVCGRSSVGDVLVVTWGRLHAMAPSYYEAMSDEALAYVNLDVLSPKGLSPEGFDVVQLRTALGELAA